MRWLSVDGRWLFAARLTRMFGYGFLSVVLVLYLARLGLSEAAIGALLSLTLIGDTALSLWLTTHADRFGRRRTLIVGALLMIFAAGVFALTQNYLILIVAATIGVISPSGNEIGPFLPIEQAALSHLVEAARRTAVFAWYNLAGSLATALGALSGGALAQALQDAGVAPLDSYRANVIGYGLIGLALAAIFTRLSPRIEPDRPQIQRRVSTIDAFGLHRSRRTIFKLSALFSLDAFAGGLVVQSFVAYWFFVRFNVEPAQLGAIFFGANVLAGLSALLAVSLARRFGLINTMVFTHLPSNVLLMLVPLMPSLPLAVGVLLLRFSISQMDVPTRQSYTLAVVEPNERSAAAGITGVARTTGAALSPSLTGALLSSPAWLNVPFFLAGGLKIVYDWLLYQAFKTARPPEERV